MRCLRSSLSRALLAAVFHSLQVEFSWMSIKEKAVTWKRKVQLQLGQRSRWFLVIGGFSSPLSVSFIRSYLYSWYETGPSLHTRLKWGNIFPCNVFNIFFRKILHCKLDPGEYREYEYGKTFSIWRENASKLKVKLQMILFVPIRVLCCFSVDWRWFLAISESSSLYQIPYVVHTCFNRRDTVFRVTNCLVTPWWYDCFFLTALTWHILCRVGAWWRNRSILMEKKNRPSSTQANREGLGRLSRPSLRVQLLKRGKCLNGSLQWLPQSKKV